MKKKISRWQYPAKHHPARRGWYEVEWPDAEGKAVVCRRYAYFDGEEFRRLVGWATTQIVNGIECTGFMQLDNNGQLKVPPDSKWHLQRQNSIVPVIKVTRWRGYVT